MPGDLHASDILAWSAAQAERPRRLAAGERVNDVDWAKVIEEIESVGRSELTSARSHLLVALLHALKVIAWPESSAARKWQREISAFLLQARSRYEPGMAQHLHLDALQRQVRQEVARLRMATPARPLPPPVVLDPAVLLDDGTGAEDLIALLRPASGLG